MSRKTMAERYAAQRSNKETRRRAPLPRVSSSATALQEPTEARSLPHYTDDESTGLASEEGSVRSRTALPRRAGAVPRRSTVLPNAAIPRVDFSYVRQDLRRIALTGVSMLVLLIIVNVVLQHFVQ